MALTTIQRENIEEKGERKLVSLKKMSFYLDLKDYSNLNGLTADINGLGGTVETFLSKDVKYVVTNRSNPNISSSFECESSSSRPSSRSRTSLNVLQDSSSNFEQKRLKHTGTVKSRADMLLQNARKTNVSKGSCDVLQVANMWGVKVIGVTMLTKLIKKLKSKSTIEKLLNEENRENGKKKHYGKCQRIKLVKPFIKYEDNEKKYMPQHRQLRDWPVLNFESDPDRTPFSKNVTGNETTKSKEIKPLQEIVKKSTNNFTKFKVGKKPGYCEMCFLNYDNIYEHVDTEKHKTYVNDKSNFSNLDMRISLLPDLQEFVESLFRYNTEPSSYETPVFTSERNFISTTGNNSNASIVSKPTKRKLDLDNSGFSLPPKKRSTSMLRNLSIPDENKMPTSVLTMNSPSKHVSALRKPLETVTNESNLLSTNDSCRSSCFKSPITIEKPSPPATRLLRSTAKRRSSPQCSSKDSSSPNNAKSFAEGTKTVITEAPSSVVAAIDSKVAILLENETDKESKRLVKALSKNSTDENHSAERRLKSPSGVSTNESSLYEKSFKLQSTSSKRFKGARRALSYSLDSSFIKELVAVDDVNQSGDSIKTPLNKSSVLVQTPDTDTKTSKTRSENVKQQKASISFSVLKNVVTEFSRIADSTKPPLVSPAADPKLSKTSYSIEKQQMVSYPCTVPEIFSICVAESGDPSKSSLLQDPLLLQTSVIDEKSSKRSYPIEKQENVPHSMPAIGVAETNDPIETPNETDCRLYETPKESKTKCPILKQKNVSYSCSVVTNMAICGDSRKSSLKQDTLISQTPNILSKTTKTKQLKKSSPCTTLKNVAIGVAQNSDSMKISFDKDFVFVQTPNIVKKQNVSYLTVDHDLAIGVPESGNSRKKQCKSDSQLFETPDADLKSPKQKKVSSSCEKVLDRTFGRSRRMLRRLGVQRSSTYDNGSNAVPNHSVVVRDTSRVEVVQECLSELEGLNITVFKDPSHPRRVVVSDDTISDLRSSLNDRSPKNLSADNVILISDNTTSKNYDDDDDDEAYIDYVTSVEANDDKIEWDLVSEMSRTSDTRSSLMVNVEESKLPTTKLKLKRYKKNDHDSDWSYKVIDSGL